jgi:hypothetical protein
MMIYDMIYTGCFYTFKCISWFRYHTKLWTSLLSGTGVTSNILPFCNHVWFSLLFHLTMIKQAPSLSTQPEHWTWQFFINNHPLSFLTTHRSILANRLCWQSCSVPFLHYGYSQRFTTRYPGVNRIRRINWSRVNNNCYYTLLDFCACQHTLLYHSC